MSTFTSSPEKTEAPSEVAEVGSKVDVVKEEVGKAMNVLKGAIEAKGKEAEGVVNQKAEEIGKKIEETVNTGLPQVRTFKDDVIVSGKEVKDVTDKKLKEAGEKVQTQVDEGRLEVESILSRLSPAGKSEEQSPEVEITPKPVKTSLLASLEKRKMQREEVEERDSSPSRGVSNVLESIAVGSAAIRSQEAASLMSTFTSSPEKTVAPSEVAEVGSKVDVVKEEVGKAMNVLKGAIEAKAEEAEEVANKKLYGIGEKVQGKFEN
ncbi:unnamed protein product [Rodentolepis nana]|uniref:Uncharacterized protein n=1 Tax=Rodentolepis nana TaxID=102285 RepID=A0A0R3TGD4_RODNA|nr:unnamed protein product [Rodentolepis nana]